MLFISLMFFSIGLLLMFKTDVLLEYRDIAYQFLFGPRHKPSSRVERFFIKVGGFIFMFAGGSTAIFELIELFR